MNVIVANKYVAMLSNLNIDLIKSMTGEFDVDDLINTFDNFFFNKMILDITAIKNYEDIATIQKLSFGLDMSKVILLLDDSNVVNSPSYLSQLVSMGIYNFTRNIDTITYLLENPNTYKDVAQFQQLSAGVGNTVSSNVGKGHSADKFIDDRVIMNGFGGTRVIGFKNLTDHAGSTSLIYMIKKQAELSFKVLAVEVDKNDFIFFNDGDLRSVSSAELPTIIKNPNNNYDMILVDLNDSPEEKNISEILYLIEPSTIKLNKMIRRDRNILDKIQSRKILLNQSLLTDVDVKDFEYEAKCKVFYNMPPLDDKKERHKVIDDLLIKLGFGDSPNVKHQSKGGKLFEIVKDE